MEGIARVATWNLWGTHGPWLQRQGGIIGSLRQVAPDLVGLQEVWHSADESQAGKLADALDLEHVDEFRPPGRPSDGLAVLSRWPIEERFELPLPTLGRDGCDCCALGVDVANPAGYLRFVVTHLAWRLDDGAVRQAQLRAIVSYLETRNPVDGPTVLVGDLNATPDSDEIRALVGKIGFANRPLVFRDAWDVAGDGDGQTWSSVNPHVSRERDPATRLDYVLVEWRPDEPGRVCAAQLIGGSPVDGMFPSDHFGVAADIRVGKLG